MIVHLLKHINILGSTILIEDPFSRGVASGSECKMGDLELLHVVLPAHERTFLAKFEDFDVVRVERNSEKSISIIGHGVVETLFDLC